MTTYMIDMFTQQPGIDGNIVDKIVHLLETDPATRNDYKLLVARYWLTFDGLDHILDDETQAQFIEWLHKATSWKTIQNRCGEVQNSRPDLEALPSIERKRQAQAKAGRVVR